MSGHKSTKRLSQRDFATIQEHMIEGVKRPAPEQDDADLPEAQRLVKEALRRLRDEGGLDMASVLTGEVALEADPDETFIQEWITHIQRHAYEQQCDVCGNTVSLLRLKNDYSRHSSAFAVMETYERIAEWEHHRDTECPVSVSGELPYGPVKLFRTPDGREERP